MSVAAAGGGQTIAVFGAYGHTARFVTAELAKRSLNPILVGRDPDRLASAGGRRWEARVATIDDPGSLDKALVGAAAVVNCAGPFAETAPAVVDAALRGGLHYLDISAESLVVLETFRRYEDLSLDGLCVVPAVGFFGALGDLLASSASAEWSSTDEITIAVALDRWQPTRGTRGAMERRAGRRVVFTDGAIRIRTPDEPVPHDEWPFPEPFGLQPVVGELSTVDAVTIPRHLPTREIKAFLNLAPIAELVDPTTPPPEPADDSGRSAQVFAVDVVVRREGAARRITAHGHDIYAITAPIVAEAIERILSGRRRRTGVAAVGELFDADDVLAALERDGQLTLQRSAGDR